MPSFLSRSSASDKSAPLRTEEIIPLPPTSSIAASPLPLLPPFSFISTPPGILPLEPRGINNPMRAHPRDVVRCAQRKESLALVVARAPSPSLPKGGGTRTAVYSIRVFDREEARRGRPNATHSSRRERDVSVAATRDSGGGGGGTSMVIHRSRSCCHRHHHPPLSNAAATAAVVVHDTVLQCIACRRLSPSQWWLIVVWSRIRRWQIRVGGL